MFNKMYFSKAKAFSHAEGEKNPEAPHYGTVFCLKKKCVDIFTRNLGRQMFNPKAKCLPKQALLGSCKSKCQEMKQSPHRIPINCWWLWDEQGAWCFCQQWSGFRSHLVMLVIFNIMLHNRNFSFPLFSRCFSINIRNYTPKNSFKRTCLKSSSEAFIK